MRSSFNWRETSAVPERSYKTPPPNLRSLDARLQNVTDNETLKNRTRRQLANLAVIECLRRNATDDHDQPIFVVKGGVAIEFLLGLNARATKDLDSSARTGSASVEDELRDGRVRGSPC